MRKNAIIATALVVSEWGVCWGLERFLCSFLLHSAEGSGRGGSSARPRTRPGGGSVELPLLHRAKSPHLSPGLLHRAHLPSQPEGETKADMTINCLSNNCD